MINGLWNFFGRRFFYDYENMMGSILNVISQGVSNESMPFFSTLYAATVLIVAAALLDRAFPIGPFCVFCFLLCQQMLVMSLSTIKNLILIFIGVFLN